MAILPAEGDASDSISIRPHGRSGFSFGIGPLEGHIEFTHKKTALPLQPSDSRLGIAVPAEIGTAKTEIETLQDQINDSPFPNSQSSTTVNACNAAIDPFFAIASSVPAQNNMPLAIHILAVQFEYSAGQFEYALTATGGPDIPGMKDYMEDMLTSIAGLEVILDPLNFVSSE